MADATSLYSSPEPRVYVKKISWYLNLEIIVIRKLCPNGKCLAVTLLFGNMAWRCSEGPNGIKHV